jgi:hypothetical protein
MFGKTVALLVERGLTIKCALKVLRLLVMFGNC